MPLETHNVALFRLVRHVQNKSRTDVHHHTVRQIHIRAKVTGKHDISEDQRDGALEDLCSSFCSPGLRHCLVPRPYLRHVCHEDPFWRLSNDVHHAHSQWVCRNTCKGNHEQRQKGQNTRGTSPLAIGM